MSHTPPEARRHRTKRAAFLKGFCTFPVSTIRGSSWLMPLLLPSVIGTKYPTLEVKAWILAKQWHGCAFVMWKLLVLLLVGHQ